MRLPRASACCFALVLTFLFVASRSRAQLLVVTSPGSPPALSHAEVAFAKGEGEPVTWLSLRIRRGPVAVVAALPEAALCEPALDAWLTALEQTVSPHVLLPQGATDCGKTPSFVRVSWPRSRGVGAAELSLTAAEDVTAALEEHGLAGALPLPDAARYVIWAWPSSEEEVTTRTLRISGVSPPLSFSPAMSWPVLVSSLSTGPRSWPGEVDDDRLGVTFVAGKPATDYVSQLQQWLRSGGAPLLEARGGSSIFGWSLVADTVSLPPLVRSYARVAAKEREDVDADLCTVELQALENSAASSGTACGGAADAGLALAAIGGTRPVLQRFVLSGSEPVDIEALREGGEPRPAALRARSVDDSACPEVVVTPPIMLPPSGGGDTAGRSGTDPVVVQEPGIVQRPYASESCSCSPGRDPYYEDRRSRVSCFGDTSSSAGDDSCSSDTSSTSSDDSCSSDTSSASSDDSCSSDTSSTSSDDSCSSDSSSRSSSDDSCSGGSDSSYDGDTCTGRAAPDPAPNATQASLSAARKVRPQRLRLSLWSLALAAVLLPIRRRKRAGVR